MLQGKLKSSYRKQETGNRVFRYVVSGSPEDIKRYEEIQGENLRLDDETGKPVFSTTRYISDNIKLIFTQNDKVVVDDTEVSKLQSLIDQYGVDVARLIMGKSNGATE